MTDKELSDCKATAIALKGIGVFGLMIFLTIPSVLILSNQISLLENIAILTFILSGLLVGFRAWHLQFDGKLLGEIALKNLDLNNLDTIIFKLFNKKMNNKSLEERVNSCHKLAKGFLVLVRIHLIFYVALMIYLFIFSHEFPN